MLERYYVRPETVDRVRESWLGPSIEKCVIWLHERQYSSRSILRWIPILFDFGEFARNLGATTLNGISDHIEAFVESWVAKHARPKATHFQRKKIGNYARNPIRQMLRLVVPGHTESNRSRKPLNPFEHCAPRFFEYLQEEKGLRESSIESYRFGLRQFAAFLQKIGVKDIRHLAPHMLSAFTVEYHRRVGWSQLRNTCGVIRVFLRYLHRENILAKDLSGAVEYPQTFRFSNIPRSIEWDQVQRVLECVDRRTPTGKRDYAILLLLATYGLRGQEVAAMTLDDIDWRNNRLRIPERKAGHSTAYPLSTVVGEALLAYLKQGRPQTRDRRIFFRSQAPVTPIGSAAVSSRCAHYIRKAGIQVPRAGSHTFRHSCVQRLVNADFPLKTIGDYVGHRNPASTQIYGKIAVEALRQVALGDGEEVL